MRSRSDGLPVRPGGAWTMEKLAYVERYAAAFTRAMKGKWGRLVYIDLLTGPGRGVRRDTGEEFDGSPIRALKALEKRIPPRDAGRVTLLCGDCDELATRVAAQLTGRTLGLAFVDPAGFAATFHMFRAFATRQIDVLFFFPDQIGIARNLAGFVTRSGHRMDALMGGSEWRESAQAKLAARRQLNPVEAHDLARSWVSRFQDKMATIGYRHYDHAEPLFTNRKNARMYHLLFFSRHPAGLKIWRNIKRVEPSGQRPLF